MMNALAKKYSNFASVALAVMSALHFICSYALSQIATGENAVKYVLLTVFSAAICLLPALLLSRMAGQRTEEEIALEKSENSPKRSDKIAVTAGGAALVYAVGMAYEKVFPNASANIPVTTETPLYMHALMIIALCAAPAVCEEILFRHVIARRFSVAGKAGAVIISAIAFGLAHFSSSMFPYAFFAGLVLGAVFFFTGSVKYSIAAHFFCNLTSYLFACAKLVMPHSAYSTLELVTVIAFFAASTLILSINTKTTVDIFKRREGHAEAISLITPAIAIYAVVISAVIILGGH